MSGYFAEIFSGTKSLAIGMGITFKYMLKPVVTVQYPYETLKMPERYRGHIELVKDPETGEAKCIVCGMCQRACPSGCITVAGDKREGEKKKVLGKYVLNFTTCSLCGSCVESCKSGAIKFSKEYNLASTRKEDYILDLLQRLKEQR
ncbi:MAG: NADH-quinone oxidoreductase subunit I [Deltaproteobacteria bacterium CG_4_10_14_3_um_filter_60_8]|nr:MAG: NADH-quinone oxidoreductase subunit I [Desulfobacterales bacterium CG2_30_60_27]PIY20916.1 MAG: NADH-quinone oxidoreductase subunit I [Deltaproteobacteria bacterium CG_4_10_14_3_um_filter_60_8]